MALAIEGSQFLGGLGAFSSCALLCYRARDFVDFLCSVSRAKFGHSLLVHVGRVSLLVHVGQVFFCLTLYP